jgi:ATP-binding protein involved in chromosome partitioning
MSTPPPYAISRRDDGLAIEWEAGAPETFYPARALRLACPCAACVEEMSGRPLLDPAGVPSDIRPLTIALVGAYGLKVMWSDNHGTGIYTFGYLRSLSGTDG